MIHPQPLKNFSILIIDDAKPPRRMLRRLLNVFGEYDYEEEENVTNAKRKVLSLNEYSLIMCDIKLPDQSGVEFLRWIRSGEAGQEIKNIPFICYSSDFEKEDIENAKALGVSGFLDKPFNFGDVYQVFSAIFNWSEETKKYFNQKIGAE